MLSTRVAKAMLKGDQVGDVVHSMPLSRDLAKELDIDTKGREGWIVGMRVNDGAAWQAVKSGEFQAFPIGGSAIRESVTDEPAQE
ncbi:MAG: hypothetical protein GVY13_01670 [Alphaproteobacteria bacterium]|jgi:hypothetical protein|nr:hypothetical protein [Alphaproteobacteria bacterium]